MNVNVLKGILIMLVIIDHNDFSRQIFPKFLEGFSFHVVGFMALPFLRPPVQFTKNTLINYFFRHYYPFLLITVLMGTLLIAITNRPLSVGILSLGHALYSGNSSALKDVTGMALLWFLPSFLSILLIKILIDNSRLGVRVLLGGAILVSHFLIGRYAAEVQNYLPLGILPAIYIVPLAYAIALAQKHWFESIDREYAFASAALIFGVVKYFQIQMGFEQEVGFSVVADYSKPFALVINDMEAIFGTLFVFQIARLNVSKFGSVLEAAGRHSLQIYLVHAFIAFAIYKTLIFLFPKIHATIGFTASFVLTVVISTILSKMLLSNSATKRFIFPRSLSDFFAQKPVGIFGKP